MVSVRDRVIRFKCSLQNTILDVLRARGWQETTGLRSVFLGLITLFSSLLHPLVGAKYCNLFVTLTLQCTLVLNLHWPSLLAGKWPDRDQTCTRWSPGKPASRVCSRSRSRSHDMGTFVLAGKSLLLPDKWPDRDQTCTRWSPEDSTSRVC